MCSVPSIRAATDVEALRESLHCDGELVAQASGLEATKHPQAEEVNQQGYSCEVLFEALSALGESILIIEGERIRFANEAFCLLSGYGLEELKALRSYLELASADQRTMLDHQLRLRLRGEAVENPYETVMLHKSGRCLELEIAAGPLQSGGQSPHLVAVFRDISARKRVEEGLQSSLSMLLAVHEAGRILGSSLDLGEIGKRLLEAMRRVSDFDSAVLRVRDEGGRLLVVCACGREHLLRVAGATSEAQAARLGALETAECRGPFRLTLPKESEMPLVGLCLPLAVRGRVVGLVEAYGPEALAKEMTVETLQSMARQAASALENALLYQELAERERRLTDLVGRLLGAKEEERRRVAYEVHDGLTQAAIAAHQHLQAFAKDYLPDCASAQKKLDNTLKLARHTVREARSVIADLRPTVLEDFGLAVALQAKVEALRAEGWEIGYDGDLGGAHLPNEIELALYRVSQEALANVCKHAQTTRAHITLARRGEEVCLEVRDWGRGFEQGVASKVNGWGEQVGIYGMRERIELLGGNFTICSRPGAGTRVIAEVPLPTTEGVSGEPAG